MLRNLRVLLESLDQKGVPEKDLKIHREAPFTLNFIHDGPHSVGCPVLRTQSYHNITLEVAYRTKDEVA
jgi:hypothetical protein